MSEKSTPWRKVYKRFGTETQTEFANLFGWDRSKVSRALADDEGLISGKDQRLLIRVAKARGVKLEATDLLPGA